MTRKLLYFCPISYGGIADYAHMQASALTDAGIDVAMLAPSEFSNERNCRYAVRDQPEPSAWLPRKVRFAASVLNAHRRLVKEIRSGFDHVLFAAYSETLAPIWAPWMNRLRRQGVRFGSIVHDPVRVRFGGPKWWWEKSLRAAWSVFDVNFVHARCELGEIAAPPVEIPHGPYPAWSPSESRETTRNRLDIPPDSQALLSFGHLRDVKNLHLAIEALRQLPEDILIVAGTESRGADRRSTEFQRLAKDAGVADRCRWIIDFVPNDEAANLFNASDVILVAYSSQFHSASGVLNLAISHRRPAVASAGNGNLQQVMNDYRLGEWIEPNNAGAIRDAVQRLRSFRTADFEWEAYENAHSWRRNAEVVIEHLFA